MSENHFCFFQHTDCKWSHFTDDFGMHIFRNVAQCFIVEQGNFPLSDVVFTGFKVASCSDGNLNINFQPWERISC